jgi:hypothetical protein
MWQVATIERHQRLLSIEPFHNRRYRFSDGVDILNVRFLDEKDTSLRSVPGRMRPVLRGFLLGLLPFPVGFALSYTALFGDFL